MEMLGNFKVNRLEACTSETKQGRKEPSGGCHKDLVHESCTMKTKIHLCHVTNTKTSESSFELLKLLSLLKESSLED